MPPTWAEGSLTLKAYVNMSLKADTAVPAQNQATFNDVSVYNHTFHAIPLTTYNADVTCRSGGSGACYNISNLVTKSGFSINSQNLSAVIFTVPPGIN